MLAQSILHERKSKKQSDCPKAQEHDQRQRSKVGKKPFAPVRGLDMQPHSAPEAPGFLVKRGRDAKVPFDASWQNHRLKRIHQDDEDENNAGNGCPPVHNDEIEMTPE